MVGFLLKIKTKNGQKVINNLTKDSTIKELKKVLTDLSNIPTNKLHVLSGFPPKNLNLTQDHLNLANSGISSGDTLILEEKEIEQNNQRIDQVDEYNSYKQHVEDPFNGPGILIKQIVPADNSCLFTSINFVLNGTVDESGSAAPIMRQLVAETIRTEKHLYDEAILGKPREEYCAWIQEENAWGGAIELSILANYFGVEIAVVDTINAIINNFGEDQKFPHRVFLLFDGIHYDPLYMESLEVSIHNLPMKPVGLEYICLKSLSRCIAN